MLFATKEKYLSQFHCGIPTDITVKREKSEYLYKYIALRLKTYYKRWEIDQHEFIDEKITKMIFPGHRDSSIKNPISKQYHGWSGDDYQIPHREMEMRQWIGQLMWSCTTRYDIVYATSLLARESHRPTDHIMIQVYKLMNYVLNTANQICNVKAATIGSNTFQVFTDSN